MRSFSARARRSVAMGGGFGAGMAGLNYITNRKNNTVHNQNVVHNQNRVVHNQTVKNQEALAGPPGIKGLNRITETGCAMTPANTTGKAFEPMGEFMLDTKKVLAEKGIDAFGRPKINQEIQQRIYAPNEIAKPKEDQRHEASRYYDASILPKPEWRPMPTFSLKEVKSHTERNPNSCWVTYRGGVYDMTEFLECHPGGEGRIRMVAGNDLEAFWKVYSLHDRPHIQNLIEHYRIGHLTKEESAQATAESTFDNYYQSDPKRPSAVSHGVRIPSIHPWNHEPQRKQLVDSFFTPNELFFVRNHNSVPDVDTKEWTLDIEANEECGLKDVSFTYEDLKTKFPRHEVVAVLQCAGNRQEDYVTEDQPLYVAPHWTGGAIGCAKWAGVKVRDVLREAGMDVDGFALGTQKFPNCRIVNFTGEDMDETGTPYAGVLPIEKTTDPWGDAILAYEMNGKTLPRDHGFPIRLLAPGHAGCRNVKWIKSISVSDKPSELDSGSKLDRHFDPATSFMGHLRHGDDHVRLELGPVIQTMPVTSIVCQPSKNEKIKIDCDQDEAFIEVKGVAYAGGGRGVCRVEVSADGGKNFVPAESWGMRENIAPEWGQGRNWAWVQFEQKIPLPPWMVELAKRGEKVPLEIVCKAVDGDFNSQPEKMENSYNSLGICINHWDRVPITVESA